ncbi:MAG TPA: hypothetical protein VIW24_27095 [Aldersonia sp.]
MTSDPAHTFTVEYVSVGPYAHGFGTAADGRAYAFRVLGATMHVEVYREGLDSPVPDQEDIAAIASAKVTDVDVDDERSIVAMVRDMIAEAKPVNLPRESGATTVRALLHRISSVIDAI